MATRPDASQLATGTPVEGGAPTYQSGAVVWGTPGGGVSEVADLAALALVAGSAPGLAWLQSLKCFWRRETASTATVDGITVIDALGGGRWERLVGTTATDWLYQGSWYVDQVAGSDEADGSSGTPVQSVAEVNRRLSVGEVHQDVTIHIQNGYFDEVWLDVDAGGRGHKVTLIGHAFTVLDSDTVASWTSYSHVTPSPNLLVGDTITDWSLYFGARIRNAAGPIDNLSWVYNEDPVGTAWIGNFPLWVGDPPIPGGIGASFVVESTDAGFGRLKLSARDSTANFEVADVFLGEVVAENCLVILSRCALYESEYPGEVFLRASSSAASITAYSCCMMGLVYPIGRVRMEECTSAVAEVKLGSSSTAYFYRCAFYGNNALQSMQVDESVYNYAREGSKGSAYLEECQSWGTIRLGGPCDITVQGGKLSGYAGSGYGLVVASENCSFTWTEKWSGGWQEPNLAGPYGQIVVAMASLNINDVWSTVNIRNLEQRGVGTLSSGQVTISARGANYWGVLVSRATRSGVAGELFVPVAQRTHAGFRVVSLDSSGTLVTTDNGTFDWYIPGPAVNIVIGRKLYGTRGLSVLS